AARPPPTAAARTGASTGDPMHTRSHTRQSAGPRGRPSAGPRRRSGNRPRITFRRENPNSGYVEKQRGPHGDAAGQKRTGGPRSIWTPRRVREVGAQFPDRQGRVSPSQALSKPKTFSPGLRRAAPPTNPGRKPSIPPPDRGQTPTAFARFSGSLQGFGGDRRTPRTWRPSPA